MIKDSQALTYDKPGVCSDIISASVTFEDRRPLKAGHQRAAQTRDDDSAGRLTLAAHRLWCDKTA
eukprot:30676-Eustigmatos_ZCMA.PRE.1